MMLQQLIAYLLPNDIPVEGLQGAAEPVNLSATESKHCGTTRVVSTAEDDSTVPQQVDVVTKGSDRPSTAPVGDINPRVTDKPVNVRLQDNQHSANCE